MRTTAHETCGGSIGEPVLRSARRRGPRAPALARGAREDVPGVPDAGLTPAPRRFFRYKRRGMSCARREAGPPHPAAAAGGRARNPRSHPTPRTGPTGGRGAAPAGSRRAASAWRRPALLPALALLLGALGLFAAAPAQAQNTVTLWSAMLDVQNYDYTRAHFGHIVGRGCTEPRFVSTTYRCRGALTDDSFSYGGQTYRVAVLQSTSYLFSGTRRNQIDIALDRNIPAAIAQRATLVVGSTRWSLADGAVGGFSVYRNGVEDASLGENGYSWLDSLPASGRVRVSLEMPAPGVPSVDGGAGRNTVWSPTLTVDEGSGFLGCSLAASADNCSVALSDDEFEYNGVTYLVEGLFYFPTSRSARIDINPTPRSNLAGMVLHLGATRLPVGSFGIEESYTWNGVNPQWSDGQQVGVRLTAPDPSPALSASGPTLSTSGAPREGAAPVTVTVTLPEPALDGGVNVTVNLGGTATWGEDYRTPVPAGPEYDDYRRPVQREGRGWFGGTSSETVQAANLLHIPSGSRSASFEIHVVDDPHEDSGETIDIGVRADHAGIQYTGRQIENCPTCSRTTSLLTYMGAAELTLTITNHEDAETEAARLAAEAAAEAERQRLAAARAAAGGPLSGLALSAGSQAVALVPAFSPNVLSYRAEVPSGTAGVTLAPHWGAEAELGGSPSVVLVSQGPAAMLAQAQVHASGTAAALALSSAGPTRLEVTVLEPDGSGKRLQGTTTTYRVEVVGAAAPQTAAAGGPLSGLALTAGSQAVALVPAFSPGVTSYRAEVPAGTREVSLEPSWGAAAAPTVWARSRQPAPHLTLLSRQQVRASGTAAALSLSPDGPTRLEVTVLQPGLTTTDYRIEVVEAAPQTAPQTVAVAFGNVPAEHDGRTAFALDVQSGSEPAPEAFTVTNGTVTGVESLDPVLWRVRVAPNSWKDVKIVLGEASAKVRGPARIRVADARAKEGKDASLDFAVTLHRAASGPVSVDYATADGTAAAGADYTAASGTLTFAAGETAKTVSVALLDDAVDEGKETFTLELSNPRGAYLRKMHREAKGVIRNDDPLQQAWLGRFGRAAASDAVAAVTARFETPRGAGSHLTFAGQRLDLSGEGLGDGAALANAVAGLARAFGAEEAPAAAGDPWNDPAAAPARAMSTRELLLGTSFRAVLGQGAGSQLTSWGQGASVSQFSGAVPGLSLSGESATGALGMDYERGALLAGFAMTHSLGAGTAHGAGQTYAMGSSVTTMLPYARFALSERISAWGLAGTGSGGLTLDLEDAAAQRYRTDLSMTLAAAGVRGDLLTPTQGASGFALALKADAFWVRTESDALSTPGVGNLAAARADATRLRAVLDGSRTFALAGGATLAPSLELGVRHDGGDAETGTGLELGAGLGFADPARGLDMALRVHGIAAHAQDGYREWGVSGSLRLAPGAAGRGLSMSLTPSYGADPGGSERLWALPDAHALAANGDAPASSRLDTELGYGLPVFGGGFTGTPNVGLGLSDTARELRMGWRLAPAAGGAGFELSLDATRRESAGDAGAEHGVVLRARTSW